MQKENLKQNVNVGFDVLGDPHFKGMAKTNKGITLIALIITIIVMLILVGVSVTVALNGGLFSTAEKATTDTEIASEREQLLSIAMGALNNKGKVDLNKLDELISADLTFEITGEGTETTRTYKNKKSGNTYTVGQDLSITLGNASSDEETGGNTGDDDTTGGGSDDTVTLPTGWTVAETKPEGWSENVTALTDGTNTIPLPNGFEMSDVADEQTVAGGLVIKEGANEFVWIPVTDYASYTEDSFGPLTSIDWNSGSSEVYDSYQEIQYFYGEELGTINSEETFNATFTYAEDKTNVENNIKTYGGFYVGRYETTIDEETIDEATIGVEPGKTVLTSGTFLNDTSYDYKWWGLYKAQKDMYKDNASVGSLMISSKQWDAIMTFTGYGSATRGISTYTTEPDLSGSAYATDSTKFDESNNIYDLAGNVWEFTLKAEDTYGRVFRGGSYDHCASASLSSHDYPYSSNNDPYLSGNDYRL